MKRAPNEEIFEDGDSQVRLVADFGALVAINSCGKDVSILFTDLSMGMMNPQDVRNILMACAYDVEDTEKQGFIESLITRYGLQECAIMARVMLSHAMIGDVKKSQLARGEVIQRLTGQLINTPSTNIRKVGLLWVVMCGVSTTLACMISSALSPLTF